MKKKVKVQAKAKVRKSRRGAQAVNPAKRGTQEPVSVVPGEVLLGDGDIVAFQGRHTVEVAVSNIGDRPIQVGSHCHFFEVNRALRFDRETAYGYRLQVPAGTAVRFEPGEEKRVTLVAIGGNRVAYGINGLVDGCMDDPVVKQRALSNARERGFIGKGATS
jgi:urease beta subunit